MGTMSNSVEHNEEEVYNCHLKRKITGEKKLERTKRLHNCTSPRKEFKIIEKRPAKDPKLCKKCGKKLKLMNDFSCRCGEIFCAAHRFHDQHDCTYDFRAEAIKKIEKDNPKVVHEK